MAVPAGEGEMMPKPWPGARITTDGMLVLATLSDGSAMCVRPPNGRVLRIGAPVLDLAHRPTRLELLARLAEGLGSGDSGSVRRGFPDDTHESLAITFTQDPDDTTCWLLAVGVPFVSHHAPDCPYIEYPHEWRFKIAATDPIEAPRAACEEASKRPGFKWPGEER